MFLIEAAKNHLNLIIWFATFYKVFAQDKTISPEIIPSKISLPNSTAKKPFLNIRRRSPLPQQNFGDYGNNFYERSNNFEPERLKAQLLDNLNTYSKGADREVLAPIESDGQFEGESVANAANILSLAPTFAPPKYQPFSSFTDGNKNSNPFPNFLEGIFGTTPYPLIFPTLVPLFPPLFQQTTPNLFESTTQSPIFGNMPWYLSTPANSPEFLAHENLKNKETLSPPATIFLNKSENIRSYKNKEYFIDKSDNINAANAIRNWRRKMYKLFKINHENNTIEDSKFEIEQNKEKQSSILSPRRFFSSLSRRRIQLGPDSSSPISNQYIIIAPENRFPKRTDNNRNKNENPDILLLLKSDSKDWIPERIDKKKAGHLAKLFGVENGGYQYNVTTTTDNYLYLDPSFDNTYKNSPSERNVENSQKGIFIPALPIITIPALYSDLNPPQLSTPGPISSTFPTLLSGFTYGSTSLPFYTSSVSPPIRMLNRSPEYYAKELENMNMDYANENENSKNGCHIALEKLKKQNNKCLAANDWTQNGGKFERNEDFETELETEDNIEMCNSPRLNRLIKETVISGDAEASKRAIQMRSESEFNSVFNVICGTGYFSYIAHTDEFCLTSVGALNCYVFSPVCNLRLEIASGIANKSTQRRDAKNRKKKFQQQKRRKKSYVNSN